MEAGRVGCNLADRAEPSLQGAGSTRFQGSCESQHHDPHQHTHPLQSRVARFHTFALKRQHTRVSTFFIDSSGENSSFLLLHILLCRLLGAFRADAEEPGIGSSHAQAGKSLEVLFVFRDNTSLLPLENLVERAETGCTSEPPRDHVQSSTQLISLRFHHSLCGAVNRALVPSTGPALSITQSGTPFQPIPDLPEHIREKTPPNKPNMGSESGVWC